MYIDIHACTYMKHEIGMVHTHNFQVVVSVPKCWFL